MKEVKAKDAEIQSLNNELEELKGLRSVEDDLKRERRKVADFEGTVIDVDTRWN